MLKLLIKLLFAIAIIVGAYFAYVTFVLKQPVDWTRFDFVALQTTAIVTLNQGKLLAENTWSQASEQGKVLGDQVKVQEDRSIPQQTFEYARYLYCQQVVKEWEKKEKGN